MRYRVIIPARFSSTRLPGKPLIDIEGMSLLERTYRQCVKVVPADLIFVATDHNDIRCHCENRGIQVIMTSVGCLTGTDRIAEVSKQMKADYFINVQGDEPLMNPQDLIKIIKALDENKYEIINGYAPILSEEDYLSSNVPKVVFREDSRLLYMSRAGIPSNKKKIFTNAYRQVCIYAFSAQSLEDFSLYNGKSPLEEIEDIEILRFLEMGYEVRMLEMSTSSIAVDTLEDLERVRNRIKQGFS